VDVLATVLDPDGRQVELTRERWAHIVGDHVGGTGHPELRPHRDGIMRAVRDPTLRVPGRVANQVWFYLEGVGPSRYLNVVVEFRQGRGHIVTAFARRSAP
jgi:hypothetical protein